VPGFGGARPDQRWAAVILCRLGKAGAGQLDRCSRAGSAFCCGHLLLQLWLLAGRAKTEPAEPPLSGVRRIRRRRHPADCSGDPSRMRRTGSPGRPLLTPWPSRDGGRPCAARFERCADDGWPSPTHDRRVTNAFDTERDHRRLGPFDFNRCAAYSRRWDCAQVNLCQDADGLRQAWTAAYGLARRSIATRPPALDRPLAGGGVTALLPARTETGRFKDVLEQGHRHAVMPTRLIFVN
jgi:hypothetical protein